MAPCQIFVRCLDGRTRCLQIPSRQLTGGELKAKIEALEGIPAEIQQLVTGTRYVGVSDSLTAGADGFFPTCSLLLPLRGGKGGFGSLLRGAATKAGQKKTSNFDACRDMSGRRLRHVNAEKKLKQWKSEAQERELEKTAEEYLKKQQKIKKEDDGIMEELKVYRELSERAREAVESAVRSGLAEVKKMADDGKRKKAETVAVVSKRPRIWIAEQEDEDLDEGYESGDEKDEAKEATQSVVFDASEPPASQVDQAEQHDVFPPQNAIVEGANLELSSTPDVHADQDCSMVAHETGEGTPSAVGTEGRAKAKDDAEADESYPTEQVSSEDACILSPALPLADASPSLSLSGKKSYKEPLDFDEFDSAEEMQALGLDRLKMELQARKLKCGGSLAERAARLFLLKTTPFAQMDRKHLTKARP